MNQKIDFNFLKYDSLIASDEVGRGCLAGDLVVCSVLINKEGHSLLNKISDIVKDSKKLSAKKRKLVLEELNIDIKELKTNEVIKNDLFSFVLVNKNSDFIDNHNILQSTMIAFYESFKLINSNNNYMWLIDGNKKPKEVKNDENVQYVIKGDNKSLLIGLASIIAKEFRDYQMDLIDKTYPDYDFKNNKGYGTKKHYDGIEAKGIIPNIHRKTFLKKILK